MKKINFFALTGIALVAMVVTSCSKERLATPRTICKYDNTDAKAMIKLADPKLYSKVYEEKQDPGTITIIKGFHDLSGNCQEDETICSIVVVTTHPALSVQDSTSLYDIDPNLTVTFNDRGVAYLVEAYPEFPTSTEVHYIDVHYESNGVKTVTLVPYY